MYLLAILLPLFTTAQCANILGVFTYPVYSHQVFFQKIYKQLSLRGHHVTVITTDPLNDPSLSNLREIKIEKDRDDWKTGLILPKNLGHCTTMSNIWDVQYESVLKLINNTEVRDLVDDENASFDLVLKNFISPFDFAFGHRFKAPVIDLSAGGTYSFYNDRYGNPNHPILYADPHVNVDIKKASKWEKIVAIYYFLWSKYRYYYHELPRYHELARKYFGEDVPYLGELERNSSMFFVNGNPLLTYARPNVPAVIEVAPLDDNAPSPLPESLKKILDEAKTGVVYISFGSNLKSVTIDKNIIDSIKEAVAELPYTVLWKWESDFMPGKPANVVIKQWFPQKDVLAHPNVKVFVTQGGLHSIEQSISAEVPMVGIPLGNDQPKNLRRIVQLGIAEQIDPDKLTAKDLKSLIAKVAKTKKYKTKVKKIRNILYDAPMTGLEKVVWWTEYVIRHGGARHLRSAAIDMHWFQFLLLDVILFLLFSFFLAIYLSYKLLVGLLRFCKSYGQEHKKLD